MIEQQAFDDRRGGEERPGGIDRPAGDERAQPGLRYPVEALIRDDDAGSRALSMTRRLVRLVSEFDPGSYATIDIETTGEGGRVDVAICLHGDAAEEVTKDDLVAALGQGVVLGAPVVLGDPGAAPRGRVEIGAAYELVRIGVAPTVAALDELDSSRPPHERDSERFDGAGFALPLPNDEDSGEALLAALARSSERVWVRTVLQPADDFAAQMVVDELTASVGPQVVADYGRVPVRARTLIAAAGRVPVAARSALRQRGSGLKLAPVAPEEAATVWDDPVGSLRTPAVAEAHAFAISRIPTAGTAQSLGIATRLPEVPERPLDPMPPAPDTPIRAGWATDAYGARVDACGDLRDIPRHYYVEGRSGSGKTTTLGQLAWSVIRAGHQVIYLDPHGDGAARVAAYSHEYASAGTTYIRHGDREHPVRLNPIADRDPEARERALADLLELIQVMLDPNKEGMVGERFKRTFTLIAQAAFLVLGPTTSITDVLAIALTKEALKALKSAVRPKSLDLAIRLDSELISLGEREFAELVSWFVSRLQPFLRTLAVQQTIGTGVDSVDLLEAMESGRNLIVDLASLDLGEDVARLLGAIWLLKLRTAMGRRSDRSRPITVFVDEAHLYTFGALPGLLAEARKFGIGIVIATQSADNLAPALARAIEANCGSTISLRTGILGAAAAAERLGGWSPRQLTRLADLTAAASLSRDGQPTTAFTLHVDHFEVIAAEGWTAERLAESAAGAASATLEELWAPYADHDVLDDAAVVASLREAMLDAQLARQRDASLDRTRRILDAWDESRGDARDDESAPATASPSP